MAAPAPGPADDQLIEYQKKRKGKQSVTTSWGTPVGNINASLTVGRRGPVLFQDAILIDELAHFSRERIPERVVHAKGAGAFGYFEVTHDITQYTAADLFSTIGKRTPMAVRFSQVFGERGYSDTVRDVRGFALKFYTDEGIWDLVGNNTPIFFIKDSILFPSFIHILKRNPVTNLRDMDMFWDFMTLRPETTHQLMIFFSDRGTPASYRNMHGYGSNTFALVNADGKFNYCKFHYLTKQGIKNIAANDATRIAGEDPDFLMRDLYNAIASGNYPEWDFYIQVMSPEQAASVNFDPFDVTKVWLHADFPLIPVGKFVLNRNPYNYFAEVEQLGFDVAHMPPGIEPSPDRMLQGRMFSYGDTQRYRLGINGDQLPVNAPFKVNNYLKDGLDVYKNQNGTPNYHPNSFGGPSNDERARALEPTLPIVGDAARTDNGNDQDNFYQARLLYQRVLPQDERDRLVDNIVMMLKPASDFLQQRAVQQFGQVDADLGRKINEVLQASRIVHATV